MGALPSPLGRLLLAPVVGLHLGIHDNGAIKPSSPTTQSGHSSIALPSGFTDPYTGMEFVCIRGGVFDLGDTFGDGSWDEGPTHAVSVQDFCLGRTEVTQGQWEAVMGANPAHFRGPNRPVEMVSWDEGQMFLRKLRQMTGQIYRLPTEAEWEYAARSGGRKEKWAGISGEGDPGDCGWYRANSGRQTHPVGQKMPNRLGLCDMSGNVSEWCQDWYGGYCATPKQDPGGPECGELRVHRGGNCRDRATRVRTAYRGLMRPTSRSCTVGLRVAASPP